MPTSTSFRLQSPLDLRMAVLDVRRLPQLTHFSDLDRSLLATVVAELGSNILKYAGSGHIRIKPVQEGLRMGVEMVAEDNGPGMADIELALREHYSSSGTLGLGLSGVRRMVSDFHIHSAPGQGCRVRVCKWMSPKPGNEPLSKSPTHAVSPVSSWLQAPRPQPRLTFDTAAINRPCYPEHVSGDSTVVRTLPGGDLLLACIDASGHGPRAHALSVQLAALVNDTPAPELVPLLQALHQHAVGTIGAAVGLLQVDASRSELQFAGVGNIRVSNAGLKPWTGISRDGVLGERFPTPDVQRFPLHADDVILMYSDGIRDTLRAQVLARVYLGSARQIAEHVLQQGGKTTDDASCVVLKCKT